MRKENKRKVLLAALLALSMLLCSFPVVYAEDMNTEIPVEAIITEEIVEEMAEEEPSADPEAGEIQEEMPEEIPEETPEEEPAVPEVPEEIPEEETVAPEVPEEATEEEPAAPVVPEEIPEEEPVAPDVPDEEPEEETELPEIPEEEPEEETEPENTEKEPEEIFCEFDDDDAGSVSAELLEIISNPEAYQKVEFTGTVDIEIKDSTIAYDRDVTLVAKVSGAESLDYFMVWEASDGEGSGWYTVGMGPEYTFVLTRENVDRGYRVVLYTTD